MVSYHLAPDEFDILIVYAGRYSMNWGIEYMQVAEIGNLWEEVIG